MVFEDKADYHPGRVLPSVADGALFSKVLGTEDSLFLFLKLITFRFSFLRDEPPNPGVGPSPDEGDGIQEPEEDPSQVEVELLGPCELLPDFFQLEAVG